MYKLATCECAAGKSASCTHVSALLHALSALHAPSAFEPPMQEVDSDVESLPCTSQPCRWKPPKKRKESILCLADATFVKNDYAKPHKKIRQVEDFDPWPDSFRGTASQSLPELLQKLKGEQLCVSLLFDSQFQSDVISDELSSPSSHNIPGTSTLNDTISQFKETLKCFGVEDTISRRPLPMEGKHCSQFCSLHFSC